MIHGLDDEGYINVWPEYNNKTMWTSYDPKSKEVMIKQVRGEHINTIYWDMRELEKVISIMKNYGEKEQSTIS